MYKEAACPLELILWDLMTSEKNKRSKYHFDSRGEHYNEYTNIWNKKCNDTEYSRAMTPQVRQTRDHIGVWYSKEKIKKSKENINISY